MVMALEQVNVSISDEFLDRFSEVVRRLRRAGLEIAQELEAIGVVSGTIGSTELVFERRLAE